MTLICPWYMLRIQLEVIVRFVDAPRLENDEVMMNDNEHLRGISKTCSQCGTVGFNRRTCPGHQK